MSREFVDTVDRRQIDSQIDALNKKEEGGPLTPNEYDQRYFLRFSLLVDALAMRIGFDQRIQRMPQAAGKEIETLCN